MDYEKICRFIAEKRKEKGMTQKELAKQLSIGDKAVSKWECGRGMPDNSIMLPLYSLLGISVNELLMGETLSEKDYNKSTEDIILTLMEEKEAVLLRSDIFAGCYPVFTHCHALSEFRVDAAWCTFILLLSFCPCHGYDQCAGHAVGNRQCKSFFPILPVNA